jgi:HEPN domain-containing protein
MANRAGDWLRQAERDVEHAKLAASSGLHEWACFAAHQAAEKAVKALHLSAGQEAWGHVVRLLLSELPDPIVVPEDLVARAQVLDGYYIPTRYPNGHPEGAPGDHYGPLHSAEAIVHAGAVLAFVRAALA